MIESFNDKVDGFDCYHISHNRIKRQNLALQAKTQRKSTGCACDQTTKKFHRSKSDKDTKIEAMMSL